MRKRWFNKLATVIMTFALVLTTLYAAQVSVSAASKPKTTKITLSATSQTIDIGGQYSLSVKSVSPKKASKAVTFTTSNSKIAEVDSNGVVTGVKKGTATITAISKANNKVKATCKISVKNIKPTKITIAPTTKTIEVGKTFTITVTKYTPATVKQEVTWSTSDATVATVSDNGVVTAVKEGTATITATSTEDSKVQATCAVTVKTKEVEPSPTSSTSTSPSSPSSPSTPSTPASPTPTPTQTPTPGYQTVEPSVDADGNNVYSVPATANDFKVTSTKNISAVLDFDKSDIDFGYSNADTAFTLLKGWDNFDGFSYTSSSDMKITLEGTGATKKVTIENAPKSQYSGVYSVTNTKISDTTYSVTATSSTTGKSYAAKIKETSSSFEVTTTRNGVAYTSVVAKSKDQVIVKRAGVQILKVTKGSTGYTIVVSKSYVDNYGVLVEYK